jgi:hypothetical protein
MPCLAREAGDGLSSPEPSPPRGRHRRAGREPARAGEDHAVALLRRCAGGPDRPAEAARQHAGRFTHVFLLEMDEPTMLARLDAPSRDNDWGRIGDTREYLRRRLPEIQGRLRAFGVIPIDARQPLDQVVDAILSRTLAGSATSQASQPSDQSAR